MTNANVLTINAVCPLCHKANDLPLQAHLKKFHSSAELEKAIIAEKSKGTSDLEIGQRYGVTYRFIEKLITKTQGINISVLDKKKKIKSLYPKDFIEESTTVWSFKRRGDWATHSGEYRGNWSPYIPRNVILKYSKPGETVLDYFCGAGTTAVEAKLLGRQGIGIDINDQAIELARRNLDFPFEPQQLKLFVKDIKEPIIYEPILRVGDARDLSDIADDSIDLICSHPPYANIIHYTDHKRGDLSFCELDEFLKEMSIVALESFRVLKPGHQCAILIGDMRKQKHVVPMGFKLIDVYLKAGFKLKELVIKRQHNCKTTGFWYENSIKYNFLLLAHEYLPIFEKPKNKTKREADKIDPGKINIIVDEEKNKKQQTNLETTTVWILPEDNFNQVLDRNVIERYAKGGDYLFWHLTSMESEKKPVTAVDGEKKNFLYIRLHDDLYEDLEKCNSESVLNFLTNNIKENLEKLNTAGYVAIYLRDFRAGKYLEPFAKKIVDSDMLRKIKIREIVVVTDGEKIREDINSNLTLTHSYLLVFQKN